MEIKKPFDNIFEGHDEALQMFGRREEILANNLANADTPHFKARAVDFASVMADLFAAPLAMTATNPAHLETPPAPPELKYRIPLQASLDGNTLETSVEQAQFAENTIRYQYELNEINGTLTDLTYALTGREK